MILGRWLNRVSLNVCGELEEVFAHPYKFSHNCLETKPPKNKDKNKNKNKNKSTHRRRRASEGSAGRLVEIMDVLGLLRIRVRRGINLAVRDTLSSDPYCVVSCESQRVKTKVVRGNCNPVWNEELTIYIKDLNNPISLSVYDKDTFTIDDNMGNARVDIKALIKCMKMGLQSLPDGTKVERVPPTKENCLSEESCIMWSNGKMTQDMILRLNDVECGEVDVQIEWIEIPGCKGLSAA